MRLDDRVALVTGGGSGIGRATALLFAEAGARVGVLSRTAEEVREVAREIERAGGGALPLSADISDEQAVKAATDALLEEWGRLDVVFANAGVNGVWAPIDELTAEEWDSTVAINLRGTFLTLKHAVPHLRERGGSIVVNASINGTRVFSNSGATAYACTKAAQLAMVKMLALELAPARIRVNAVCPGAIETQIGEHTEKRGLENAGLPVEFPRGNHPLSGAPGTAEQVARLVLFLASPAAEHITGTPVWIDGGESLLGMVG